MKKNPEEVDFVIGSRTRRYLDNTVRCMLFSAMG